MEIKKAAEMMEGPKAVMRAADLQKVLNHVFGHDAQRKALGESALRAIDHGLQMLRSIGVELKLQLVNVPEIEGSPPAPPALPKTNLPAKEVGRK